MRLIPYISFEVIYTNVLENIIQINIILLLLYEIVGENVYGVLLAFSKIGKDFFSPYLWEGLHFLSFANVESYDLE